MNNMTNKNTNNLNAALSPLDKNTRVSDSIANSHFMEQSITQIGGGELDIKEDIKEDIKKEAQLYTLNIKVSKKDIINFFENALLMYEDSESEGENLQDGRQDLGFAYIIEDKKGGKEISLSSEHGNAFLKSLEEQLSSNPERLLQEMQKVLNTKENNGEILEVAIDNVDPEFIFDMAKLLHKKPALGLKK